MGLKSYGEEGSLLLLKRSCTNSPAPRTWGKAHWLDWACFCRLPWTWPRAQSRQDVPFLGLCFWSAHTWKLLGTELEWAFPNVTWDSGYSKLCAHHEHFDTATSAGFGEQVGEVEEWSRWMFLVWAPAFAPCCFIWRLIYLLLQLCVNKDTASIPAASPVLVKFSEGFWKSCWPSTANTERKCLHWSRLILVCSKLSPGLPAGERAGLLSA